MTETPEIRPLSTTQIAPGERRLRAVSTILNWPTIPAIVRDLSDEQADAIMLAENVHRVDLNPLDEAQAYRKRMARHGWSVGQVADAAHVTTRRVANRLKLLELAPEAQDLIACGQMGVKWGLERLARDVAQCMGFEWAFCEVRHERIAVLAGPDGCEVHLSPDWPDRGRLAVTGGYPPEYEPYGDRRPRVTLSPAKGPHKVARDILRRFFPKYHPIYLEMVAARRKAERDHARAGEMLDELAAALDGHARVGSYRDTPRLGDRSYKASTRWRADAPYLKLEVTAYSGEIKIELERLPLDLAREVCALVRERLGAVAVDGS